MWIFLSIMYLCDTWLFSKGYNSFFHSFKTIEEKELRKYSIAKAENEAKNEVKNKAKNEIKL